MIETMRKLRKFLGKPAVQRKLSVTTQVFNFLVFFCLLLTAVVIYMVGSKPVAGIVGLVMVIWLILNRLESIGR